jgi:hypothetical protein
MLKGCYTCRRRRVKCDNTLPFCRKCHHAGIECLGYQKPLVWVKGGVASRGKMMGLSFGDIKENDGTSINTKERQQATDLLPLSASPQPLKGDQDSSLSLLRRTSHLRPETIAPGTNEPLSSSFNSRAGSETVLKGTRLPPIAVVLDKVTVRWGSGPMGLRIDSFYFLRMKLM